MPRRSRSLLGVSGTSTAVLRSIQRGTITLADGQTTNTATITAVTTSRAYVRWLGFDVAAPVNSQAEARCTVALTDSTTVTATRGAGAAGAAALIVSYEVVEFSAGLFRSIQTGTVTIANTATSGTATVTAVVTAKTALSLDGWRDDDAVGLSQNVYAHIVLTNSTTVTATRIGTAGTLIAAFTLLEFL